MRTSLQFALAAIASFAIGFLSVRGMGRAVGPKGAATLPPVEPAAQSAFVSNVNNEPADSQARVEAVLKLCDNVYDAVRIHGAYVALMKLDAHDFETAAKDLPELLKRIQVSQPYLVVDFAEAWMDRWLEVDTPGALRYLSSSPLFDQLAGVKDPPGWMRGSVQGGVFKALARRQPEWTEQYLAAKEPGPQRDAGVQTLIEETVRQNAAKGKQYLAVFSSGANRSAAVEGYVTGLAAVDAHACFEAAAAEPTGPFRTRLMRTAMDGAGTRGVATARELLDRVDDPELRLRLAPSALRAVCEKTRENPLSWIQEESARASDLDTQEGSSWRNTVSFSIQHESVNPTALADWAAGLPNDPKHLMLAEVSEVWMSQDLAGLQGWLASAGSKLDTAALDNLGPVFDSMSKYEQAPIRVWSDTLPPGPLRDRVNLQVALNSGEERDLIRAEAIYASVAQGDTTGDLSKQLAGKLAAQNGPAAAEWVMQQPEGPARKAAIVAVVQEWSERDPQASAAWLRKIPDGPEHDAAVREYTYKVAYCDPAAAAEWVTEVGDPAARAKIAEDVFWLWGNENPTAAGDWLRALPGVDEAWKVKTLRRAR